MKIDLFPLPTITKRDVAGKTAIVIDALRATSSIVTAIDNGCREVIPVVEISEAMDIAARLGRQNVLLCGERGGLGISGFDLTNSPLEYTAQCIGGKPLIMTTTNGTRAINSAKDAKCVLLSAFVNAFETAYTASSLMDDITIICAGSGGRFSLEDTLAAGAVISRLRTMTPLDLCDLSLTAEMIYKQFAANLHEPLAETRHYVHLRSLGLQADLDYCLKTDVISSVPIFSDGVIRKAVLRDAPRKA